ncbi:unnamed protein product [Prunus armeniaca]
MSQGNVARHVGGEGDTKLACRKAMWHAGAEGDAKLACRKAMCLGTRVPDATQSSHGARQCG